MTTQRALLFVAFVGAAALPAHAGKIVVSHDEWTVSNTGFSLAPDAAVFVENVASWFTGGGSGSFLGYSVNFSLNQSSLAATLSGAGHSYLASTAVTFDLPTLMAYDGVFLAGSPYPDPSVLIAYVNAGGNVLLLGGTGDGGSAAEEANWDPFLNAFNLDYSSPYNGVNGVLPITSPHPIFSGVSSLYQNNGNSVSEINPADPLTDILEFSGNHGLYGVYASAPIVPESSTVVGGALVTLLAGLTLKLRRNR